VKQFVWELKKLHGAKAATTIRLGVVVVVVVDQKVQMAGKYTLFKGRRILTFEYLSFFPAEPYKLVLMAEDQQVNDAIMRSLLESMFGQVRYKNPPAADHIFEELDLLVFDNYLLSTLRKTIYS